MLELRNVTVRRAGRVILDQIDLAVAPGEHLVLTGPSGGGKSTLSKWRCCSSRLMRARCCGTGKESARPTWPHTAAVFCTSVRNPCLSTARPENI